MRDFGEIELVQSILPDWTLWLILAITRLGDPSVLVLLIALAYVYSVRREGVDRDRWAHAFAIVIGGLALLAGLKAIFALPRPAAELGYVATASTAFPSGHALGATVVYGTFALTIRRPGTTRLRTATAALLVGLIGLSRIALGVHYAVDVLAGIVFGVAFLVIANRLTTGRPTRAFALATAIAVVGFVAGAFSAPSPYAECPIGVCVDRDVAIAVGATLGGLVAWTMVERHERSVTIGSRYGAIVALCALVGLTAVGIVFAPETIAFAVGAAVSCAFMVSLPRIVSGVPLRKVRSQSGR